MVLAAPVERVWALILDPKVMAGCVPGTQSVEVISDVEYRAEIKVKISFIAARFRILTKILETRPPHYLRCEGAGEDSSVASSVKQTTEIFLSEQPGGATELRLHTKADVFGRLGSFGLSVMKTQADRMWETFGDNLAAVLRQDAPPAVAQVNPPAATAAPVEMAAAVPKGAKWWNRVFERPASGGGIASMRLPTDIYTELQRGDFVIRVLWPSAAAPEAVKWLEDATR